MKEMWAGGGFSAPTIEETAIRNAAATGYCNALDDILQLDVIQMRSENESGE